MIKFYNIVCGFRHYFIVPTNPGEQFYVFSSLAAWLIRKIGKRFEQPQEYDDPNSTITSILDVLRTLVRFKIIIIIIYIFICIAFDLTILNL